MSWLRLGEAYSQAGRYAAAFKALEHARDLDPEDWVASYFIGEVQRQTGAHEEAIKAFESILQTRPQELGVLQSLGQTYLDLGRVELSTGFSTRAETSFVSAVRITLELVNASSGFRRVAWKTIADALFHLSACFASVDDEDIEKVVSTVVPLVTTHPGKGLLDVLTYPLSLDDPTNLSLFTLQVALAAYDYRLTLGGLDDAAKGTAHYDLGAALSAYARRTLDSVKREAAEKEAISQYKLALHLEPTNDSFWVALGNATFISQRSVCQHSYIRALEIDGKVTVFHMRTSMVRTDTHAERCNMDESGVVLLRARGRRACERSILQSANLRPRLRYGLGRSRSRCNGKPASQGRQHAVRTCYRPHRGRPRGGPRVCHTSLQQGERVDEVSLCFVRSTSPRVLRSRQVLQATAAGCISAPPLWTGVRAYRTCRIGHRGDLAGHHSPGSGV